MRKKLFFSIFLVSLFICISAWAEDKPSFVYSVKVLKGNPVTVKVPCNIKKSVAPDTAAVEGLGRVVSIAVSEKATVTLICEGGEWAYSVELVPVDDPHGAQQYLDIHDPLFEEYMSKQVSLMPAEVSTYDKESLLSDARTLLSAMVLNRPISGYQDKADSWQVPAEDKDLKAMLMRAYAGRLFGYVYKLTNISQMGLRLRASDFSTTGVVYVYSNQFDRKGDMELHPGVTASLYIVRVGTARERVPWKGGEGTANVSSLTQTNSGIPFTTSKEVAPGTGSAFNTLVPRQGMETSVSNLTTVNPGAWVTSIPTATTPSTATVNGLINAGGTK